MGIMLSKAVLLEVRAETLACEGISRVCFEITPARQ